MKQKMVIKVQMSSDKYRTKVMKLIASVQGVGLIKIKGEDKDHFVVIGESVDPVKLVSSLRKKVGHAEIISVKKVKGDDDHNKEEEEEGEEAEPRIQWYPNYYPYYPYSSAPLTYLK